MNVLLYFPPLFNLDHPYGAIPILTAYLKKQGIKVKQKDLNAEFLHSFYKKKYITQIYNNAKKIDVKQIKDEKTKNLKNFICSFSKKEFIKKVKNKTLLKEKHRSQQLFFEFVNLFSNYSYEIIKNKFIEKRKWINPLFYNYYVESSLTPITAHSNNFFKFIYSDDNPYYQYFKKNITKAIKKENPILVGISITVIGQMLPAFSLARVIKEINPKTHITLGGSYITHIANIIKKKQRFFDLVDSIIIFDGEYPLKKLFFALKNKNNLKKVPNLLYKIKNKVFSNKIIKPIDLDDLDTPIFNKTDLRKYSLQGVVPLQTSRGCYWSRCRFCSYRFLELNYRTRSISKVIKDIKKLVSKGINIFLITDAANTPIRFKKISEAIIDNKLGEKITWGCFARLDAGFNKETLKTMYNAGCRYIDWGLESGSENTLEYINKGINLKTASNILKYSAKQGIINKVNLIFGFPNETFTDIEKTIKYIEKNAKYIGDIYHEYFSVERNTIFYEDNKKYNVQIKNPEKYDLICNFNHNTKFTTKELEKINNLFEKLKKKIKE